MSAVAIELQCNAEIILEKSSAAIIKFPQSKNKGGRPSRYTAELADEICVAILNSDKGIKRLCKENKHWPSKKTIFNWLKKNKEFQRQYKVAKEIQIDFLMDELLDFSVNEYIYIDEQGNKRIHPITLELYKLGQDVLKWKIVHLQLRKYQTS